MKTCTLDLAERLNTDDEFLCCDVYKLMLVNGSVYYIADFDEDVVFNGTTYRHDLFLLSREQTKETGTPTVDTLTVTVSADAEHGDALDNVYFMKAVHEGVLDDAYLTLSRVFMDAETGSVLGLLPLFNGRCEVTSCGGISCKLSVKSETLGLKASVPVRTFAPQNAYESAGGSVTTASTDTYTCMIPLKPSKNVLVKL